jgi:hypothetical protein
MRGIYRLRYFVPQPARWLSGGFVVPEEYAIRRYESKEQWVGWHLELLEGRIVSVRRVGGMEGANAEVPPGIGPLVIAWYALSNIWLALREWSDERLKK